MQYPMGSSDPCPVWRSMLKNSCYNEQNEWGEADAHEMTYYKFSGSTQNLKNIASKQMLEIATFSLGLQSRPIKVRIFLLKWELLNLCHPLTSHDLFRSTILFSQKEEEEKNGSRGTNGQQQTMLHCVIIWNCRLLEFY